MNSHLTHRLWLSHLKRHIPESLRMDAMRLLYHLSSKRQLSIEEVGSIINRDNMDALLSALISAGVIEEGFTSIKLVDDDVFIDFIKSLYKRELSGEPQDKVEKGIQQKTEHGRGESEGGFLNISFPSTSYSAPILIRMLEEVSRVYGISSEVTGGLQIAIADTMNILPIKGESSVGFKMDGDDFLIRIDIPLEGVIMNDEESLRLIRGIVDDIRIERLPGLTRLMMSKKVYKSFQPSLQ